MPGQESAPWGSDAGECGTCLTLVDSLCKGINVNGPSLVLVFLSLGMLPSRKQRNDHTQLLRLSTLLSIWMKAADLLVTKQKRN